MKMLNPKSRKLSSNNAAYRFLNSLRKQFRALRKDILSHPFIASIERGKAPVEKLIFFTKQQYHIINGDLRNLALYIAISPEQWIRDFFIELIQGECIALDNLYIMAEAMGVNEKELGASEPNARTLAFTNYFTRLGTYGTLGEISAAILLDFECWGENCFRLSKGLKKHYGLTHEHTKFLDGFYPIPDQFYKTVIRILTEYSGTSKDRTKIKTAVRLGLDYELMFWDTINDYRVLTT
jgi:thiaminase